MFDKPTRTHYGYTWYAGPLGGGQYRFSVMPLDPSVLQEAGPIAPLARPTLPMIVGHGSAFEVAIYSSGSARVYDRYEVSGPPLPLPPPAGPDLITLSYPQLYINGGLALDSGATTEASGQRVTVRLRGRGEYVLTLDPAGDPRFEIAGNTKGNEIEFQSGGDEFRIDCTGMVVRGEDRAVYLSVKQDRKIESSGFSGSGPVATVGGQ
jgi:hypothetical protein